MEGYNGDTLTEQEWDAAELQESNAEDDECYEGSSDLFDD